MRARSEHPAGGFAACASGAAVLEFALVLPILLALVAGTVEIGRGLVTYLTLEKAVRGGARYLARIPDPTCEPACSPGAERAIRLARAQIAEETGLSPAAINVAPSRSAPAGTVVLRAEVRLDVDLLRWLGIPSPFTISAAHQEQRVAG